MRMSLTLNSQKLLHDPEYLQEHIEQRAVAGVEEELSLLLDKLNHLHVSDANNS